MGGTQHLDSSSLPRSYLHGDLAHSHRSRDTKFVTPDLRSLFLGAAVATRGGIRALV